jgi:hypothetical protein
MPLKLFHKIEKEGILSYLFHEDSITLIPKPFKKTRRKKFKINFLMKMDTKMINKLLANQIQQQIKKYHKPQSTWFHSRETSGSTYAK